MAGEPSAFYPHREPVNVHERAGWVERTFLRKLSPEWIAALRKRSAGAAPEHEQLASVRRAEPDQPAAITLPALIEGAIGRPGDIDRFPLFFLASLSW